jgi:large subunit ribosomal protein L18
MKTQSLLIQKRARLLKKKKSIRSKIFGTSERPRISVKKTSANLYIQAIDDEKGFTIESISSLVSEKAKSRRNVTRELANDMGSELASKLLKKGVEKAVFDRNGSPYHGKVKEVAEGIRKAGLFL